MLKQLLPANPILLVDCQALLDEVSGVFADFAVVREGQRFGHDVV